MRQTLFLALTLLCLLSACQQTKSDSEQTSRSGAFSSHSADTSAVSRIVASGELIVTTLSGPDTYYDYQGQEFGVQFALAQRFAASLGVGIRVEVASDTLTLVNHVLNGDADLIALQLPESFAKSHGLRAAGAKDSTRHTAWMVPADEKGLAEALDEWYGSRLLQEVTKNEKERVARRHTVRRTPRPAFVSQQKGIISTYDPLFKEAAAQTGWDWKLIAAQCYQESTFDPSAISWAGAKGLMQLMPATAQSVGLSEAKIFNPNDNVAAAARLILRLQRQWSDIRDPVARIPFVLASYNGGTGHIRDAQKLARKHGANPQNWASVAPFVLHLEQPRFYRDPVVTHGYMIGSETYHYVEAVLQRWATYGGRPVVSTPLPSPGSATPAPATHKRNRFSTQQKILSPEEMQNAGKENK